MTNGEKILVGIVVIAAIITTIIVITSNNAKNKIENQKNEINNIEHYLNGVDENKTNNNITDNEIKENEILKENETTNDINNTTGDNVIGKEEGSNNQNAELDNEKKAIKLAQKEWGLSINAYNFEAKLQENGTYEVTVRGKSGNLEEIVTYLVNLETGVVEDITD
ncbi:MAG: hypothetical protein HFJ60_00415 [Clostridia bacterium]|jgi:type II secretory pathway pseudopilin PulG|nr:hypothetical protein [Clostridia bacterium]